MAHYDVVPVEEENWQKPPFGAVIEDGVMWGRGTLDTKVTFNGILFAANSLIGSGFAPEHDVYMAFSGGEEVNGPGAVNVVDWFVKNGVTPAFVLDEGGAVVDGVFPGVTEPCALIGIAEKGLMNLEYTVKLRRRPRLRSAAPHTGGRLSAACAKVENAPLQMPLHRAGAQMFDTLGAGAPSPTA
jgi:carboxypeptidase PM20D1